MSDIQTVEEYYRKRTATLESEKAALERECNAYREVNESVSVCEGHCEDMITYDGCLVCDLQIAKATRVELYRHVEELEKLLGEARLAMMEPYGEWKDVRENKVIVKIREALGVNFWPPRRTLVVGEEG
jgi:hypothetical protein